MSQNREFDTPAARLRAAREAAGYKTAADAVERFGWKQSTYFAHENGQNGLRSGPAAQYGRAFKISAAWLLTGEGETPKSSRMMAEPQHAFRSLANTGTMLEIGGAEFGRIPVYDIRVAAGVGAENHDETPIDHYMISLSLLHALTDSPLKYIAGLQVLGDSMEEALHNRDWVLVDMRQNKLTREGIYALNFDGDAIVKRASQHLETKAVTLTSDNPKYPPQTIKKPDRLSVIGRVILSIRRH